VITGQRIWLYRQTTRRQAEDVLSRGSFPEEPESFWFDIDRTRLEGVWLSRTIQSELDWADGEDLEINVLLEIALDLNEVELESYRVREDQWPHETPLPQTVAQGWYYAIPAATLNGHLKGVRFLTALEIPPDRK
jgi:hypothetical protein